MKPCFFRIFPLAVCLIILSPSFASAQSLTDALIKERPTKLATEARGKGDIVRGAILFHQGNINCVKCHRTNNQLGNIGPVLGQLGDEVTDELIIEAILAPSKVIKKGFETVSVLNLDGRVFTGIIVLEDKQKVVLRDQNNIEKVHTISRDEIEEIQPIPVSTMPAGLADELKNRQQFLDLIRYVIDVKERGVNADATESMPIVRRKLSDELEGLVHIKENNCLACHTSSDASLLSKRSFLVDKQAPRLAWSTKQFTAEYLRSFIANPHAAEPGTSMPKMLDHLSETDRQEAANAIVHFLYDATKQVEQETTKINADEIEALSTSLQQTVSNGQKLFHSLGCVACHAPRDDQAKEIPTADSIALGDLSNKYRVSSLSRFLEDPHVARPSGRMPNMQLSHKESIAVASYLLQATDNEIERREDFVPIAKLVDQGETLFTNLGCAKCHRDLNESVAATPNYVALENLNVDKGCLSKQVGRWPSFSFDENDVSQIKAALANYSTDLTNAEKIDSTLAAFNCAACHRRGDFGGVTSLRNPHFQTTNLNLGDQGRIPPALTGVGAKLKPKWMRDVLVNRKSIRPYMNTRMPQYGEANIGHLVELFQTTDKLPDVKYAEFEDQKEMRKYGLELAGNKGLNCVACHTYQYKLSDTMPAVDLTEMSERLKKKWFHRYMLDPQKFSPNTVMPSFWPNGKAIRPDLAGEPNYQIEAMWQYLIDGRQASAPRGIIREPLEIVVTNEAQMLRRSYPGIGKRGIGVGLPGGVNFTYDAEQMRVATIWKGKFVDPSGVWYGQGHGNVRAMGRTFNMVKGPELDEAKGAWVVDDGRPPNHQFKGYVLDEVRRPMFLYQFGSIHVEDFHSELKDANSKAVSLRRQVKMTSRIDRKGLRFRIADDASITRNDDGSYLIGDRLTVRIQSDHPAEIEELLVEDKKIKRLQVPLAFAVGQSQTLVLEYQWD